MDDDRSPVAGHDCTDHTSQRVLSAVAGRPGHRHAPDGPPGCLPLYLERRERGARDSVFARLRAREIESPKFFTLGHAFKALWDREPWLQEYSCSVLRHALR